MLRPRLVLQATPMQTRLLLTSCEGERVRAVLPPPGLGHPRAARKLLEGLSLWLGRPLSVVLCADDLALSCALGLCDDQGHGRNTVHYGVAVLESRKGRRGLGSFRELRQRPLRGVR